MEKESPKEDNNQEDLEDQNIKKSETDENSKIQTPEEEMISLNKQIDELKDQKLRAIAELENFRKRSEKDQSDALKYGISNFAKEVISIMDNIERAKTSIDTEAKQDSSVKSVLEGIDLIHQSISGVFHKFGIKKIESLNQKFDHNFHQAMMEIERNDCEPGTVVQELITGYTLHDRLLRPTMVGVSKKVSSKENISDEKNP